MMVPRIAYSTMLLAVTINSYKGLLLEKLRNSVKFLAGGCLSNDILVATVVMNTYWLFLSINHHTRLSHVTVGLDNKLIQMG